MSIGVKKNHFLSLDIIGNFARVFSTVPKSVFVYIPTPKVRHFTN